MAMYTRTEHPRSNQHCHVDRDGEPCQRLGALTPDLALELVFMQYGRAKIQLPVCAGHLVIHLRAENERLFRELQEVRS